MEKRITKFLVQLLKSIGLGIINNSYWICLAVCMIALILYVAGQRKAGKYISISFIIYFILESLRGFVK